jgi:hypothetical protein
MHGLQETIQKIFSPGNYIDAVWQLISKSTIISIVEAVKSKMLQFFLEMNEQFNNDINFQYYAKRNAKKSKNAMPLPPKP